MPQFKIDLFQTARLNVESFEVEAGDEKEARKMAKDIFAQKEYEDTSDFEITDVTPEEPEEVNLTEGEPVEVPEPETTETPTAPQTRL